MARSGLLAISAEMQASAVRQLRASSSRPDSSALLRLQADASVSLSRSGRSGQPLAPAEACVDSRRRHVAPRQVRCAAGHVVARRPSWLFVAVCVILEGVASVVLKPVRKSPRRFRTLCDAHRPSVNG
eukprot:5385220-Pleurochrysis_carterae.AAC.1